MKKILWSIFEVAETVIIAVIAVFLVRTFIAQPFLVSGASMEPMFQNGDYLLIDELSYYFREPQRGEVIVFRYPSDPRSFYIKRIIALPGETIEVRDGSVFVSNNDNKPLSESYIHVQDTGGNVVTELKENEYFVMGDNRPFSFDSRSWGPLERSDIVGVARLRLWPVSKAMAFSAPSY